MFSVKVNGELISKETVNYKLKKFIDLYKKNNFDKKINKQKIENLKIELLQQLTDELLIVQYGKRNNLIPSNREIELELSKITYNINNKNETANVINDITNKLIIYKVVENSLSDYIDYDKALTALYEQNKQHFSIGRAVKVRHILIKIVSEEDALLKIESALKRVRQGEDFAEVAKDISECQSSLRGGDIGYITANKVCQEVESRAFDLKKYEISDIFKTEFGFHIIQVLDKVENYIAPFESVKEKLAEFLYRGAKKQVLNTILDSLKEKAEIEYIELG